MKVTRYLLPLLLLGAVTAWAQKKEKPNANKDAVIKSVESKKPDLTGMSDKIWAYAETALKEKQSSKLLADYAEAQGFKVDRGVAGLPTAFIASYGTGKPVIGILGEYDALPGISQKAMPTKEPLAVGGGGHGCGHNLFGVASLAAAISIKELIQQGKLRGTIRFYGTPAEEAVGGKIYMAREGLFNDLDVCLDWHPGTEIQSGTQSSKAMVDFIVEFKGKAAHAAGDPWNGRSAVDGLEAFTDGVNMLREHVRPTVRMHYAILAGGDVPNVVPEYAKTWMWVRDSKRDGVQTVFERVQEIAKGAAIIAGVESKLSVISGNYEIMVNHVGAEAVQKNIEQLGPISYTDEEQSFAKKIQETSGSPVIGLDGKIYPMIPTDEDPSGGSTDTGDISWVVPTVRLRVTTGAKGAPWHSWAEVACAGMSIGHKGMVYAAKALAMTMVDLYEQEPLRKAVRDEFEKTRNGHVFKPYIPEGPPPLPEGN
jgi:aminobenzoyl-glutamate utilization protein B